MNNKKLEKANCWESALHQSYSLGAATRSALLLQSGMKGKRPDGLAQVPGDGHSGLLVKPLFVEDDCYCWWAGFRITGTR